MMLNRLLELLRAGGTHRVSDLARELDTTPELIEVMLEGLGRMGYLKRLGRECVEKCTSCPVAGLCAAGEGGQPVWTLTEEA
jgi:hypothetical protein